MDEVQFTSDDFRVFVVASVKGNTEAQFSSTVLTLCPLFLML